MKKHLLFFFFLILFNKTFASSGDSTSVSICTETGDLCYGSPTISETVQHFDSTGFLIETDYLYKQGCDPSYTDSILRLGSRVFYSYEVNGLIFRDSTINYSFPDSNIIVNYLRHDTTGNVLSDSTIYYSPDTSIALTTSIYDSLNHLILSHRANLYPPPVQIVHIDSAVYTQSLVYQLSENWNGSSFDTSFFSVANYDSLNRNIYLQYGFGPYVDHIYNYYFDSIPGINDHITSSHYYSGVDSVRTITFQNSLGADSVAEYLTWDSAGGVWNEGYFISDIYDSLNRVVSTYSIYCSDTTCSDTDYATSITYDYLGRKISTYYYNYVDDFSDGSDWTEYDNDGYITSSGSVYETKNGCGGGYEYDNTYNSLHQIIHQSHETYGCDYTITDCDDYSLNSDSLLFVVSSDAVRCRNQYVYPIVVAEGGTPPYHFHWSPGNDVTDSTAESPGISIDTLTTLSLTITDSLGLSYTNTIQQNVYPNPVVSLGNDSVLCTGESITLNPGNFISYLWNDSSEFSTFTVTSNQPDSMQITVTVTNNTECSNSDTVNLIFTVCAGIPDLNNSEISFYPNPFSDNITLTVLSEINSYQLQIFDEEGSKLIEKFLNPGMNKIDLQNLSPGIYILNCTDMNNIFHTTIVKL